MCFIVDLKISVIALFKNPFAGILTFAEAESVISFRRNRTSTSMALGLAIPGASLPRKFYRMNIFLDNPW